MKPLTSILIKPAGPDCNMSCNYCFYQKKSKIFPETSIHRISIDILEETIRQVLEEAKTPVSFNWQGGEPTLMGLSFFQKAIDLQKKYGVGKTVGNTLQTNGLLLNREWAAFLKENQFLVGLSLDGPEHIHNRYRFLKGGKGSWSHVVDKAKLLLDCGVAVNTLTVVNDYSVHFPEEIYVFHKNLGLTYMQFIHCLEPDPSNPDKEAYFCPSPEAYGEFLIKLFNLWMEDFKYDRATTSVRFFDSIFYTYVGLEPPECTFLPECGIYVVVEHNGDVYPCDFFVEPRLKLGNIMEKKLIIMLNSNSQETFGKLKSALPKACLSCRWLYHCQGGCPKDRRYNPTDPEVNYFCDSFKMFFERADSRMKQLAIRWKQEQEMASKERYWRNVSQPKKIGRNEPCPCGSGLKYKNCCGSNRLVEFVPKLRDG
jgi:uncharacterized protein